ncbi:MAG: gfo/Idh/MocA family oxidoreductase, partial [Acidobacteriia bacterium]|nr:gfo/Idh/MocA family oxidoreductase [Terriglobia bacterium]
MNTISRRSFMAGTAAAASMLRVSGANDRIRLGIIGTGGRGSYLMGVANQVGGLQWVAVCDAW